MKVSLSTYFLTDIFVSSPHTPYHTSPYDLRYPWYETYETSYNRRQLKHRHYTDNNTIQLVFLSASTSIPHTCRLCLPPEQSPEPPFF